MKTETRNLYKKMNKRNPSKSTHRAHNAGPKHGVHDGKRTGHNNVAPH